MVFAIAIIKQVDQSVYCAHCCTNNQDALESCGRCGELLERMNPAHVTHLGIRICPDCTTVNAPRARFCTECGRNVDDVIATNGATPPAYRPAAAIPAGARRSPVSPVPPPPTPPGPGTQGSSAGSSEVRRPAPSTTRPTVTTGGVRPGRSPQDLRADSDVPSLAPNDSGTPESRLPTELQGWNLGALFLPFVWGPYNRVWIGLAVLIVLLLPVPPMLGILIYGPITMYVGMRGNELAWRARKWDSVEQFRSVQGQWAKWGTICFIVFVCAILIVMSSGSA